MDVFAAMRARQSARAYLPKPVARADIEDIFKYLDVGLGVSYLLLAAHAKGLATCPIGLVTAYAHDIAEALDIPANKEIILSIALGYADPQSPINRFKTERENLDAFCFWYE